MQPSNFASKAREGDKWWCSWLCLIMGNGVQNCVTLFAQLMVIMVQYGKRSFSAPITSTIVLSLVHNNNRLDGSSGLFWADAERKI